MQNPNFVGRRTDLNKLHDRLQETKRLAITAVSGMGGIGKTALALQYAYKQADFYAEGRLWLTVGAGFAEEIVSFGRSPLQLGIDEGLAIAEKVLAVWQSWPGESPVLIIIDNVNKEQDYKEIQPFLPTDARFKVLMTSRVKFAGVSDLPLDVLPLSETVQLLETLAGSDQRVWERGAAEVLCQRLGRLPLALSLVGSYLGNDRGLTLADVTQQLQAKGLETGWLNQADPSVAERGLKAAIDLSWEILESRVQDFACFLSWFAYAPIPWYLVESAIAILKEQFSSADQEKSAWINSDLLDLRQILVRFHFLKIEDNTLPSYKIHPLLQQYLRDKATEQIDPNYRKGLVQAIVQEAKKIEYNSPVQQLEALRPALPHITEVAEVWIGDIIDEDNIIEPSNRLAWFYNNLVDYPQAQFWYQKARTTAQESLPAKHPVIATTLNNLAVFYTSQGKYDEAETIFLEVLKIKRETLPFNHYLLTPHINNLANLYRLKAKYKKAEILQLECLKIERESLPINYSQLSSCLNNLALLYKFQGKYDKAESLYLESLKIKQEKFPTKYLEFISTLNNLATLYHNKGNYIEAESSLSKVLSIARCNLLPNNPQLAIYINNLAELYRSQKKYKEAEKLRLECLKIECESLSSNHPQLEFSRNNLAILYQLQGKYNDAEEILQEVLLSARKSSLLNHPNLAIPLNNLAELYRLQGKYSKAKPLYQEALTIFQTRLPPNHPNLASGLNNLALLYHSQGKYNKAEPLFQEALAICEKSLDSDHPLARRVRENYQLFLQQKEEHQT